LISIPATFRQQREDLVVALEMSTPSRLPNAILGQPSARLTSVSLNSDPQLWEHAPESRPRPRAIVQAEVLRWIIDAYDHTQSAATVGNRVANESQFRKGSISEIVVWTRHILLLSVKQNLYGPF
jgi:hypothetical protein